MNGNPRACIVFSDYPIKTMAYQRFLSNLGEETVYSFRSLDLNFRRLANAKLVICDMNIMVDGEPGALEQLEATFTKANILFLEEDHSDMVVKFANQRDICRLGKLTDIAVIHSTLKELLLQSCQRVETRQSRPKRKPERLEET